VVGSDHEEDEDASYPPIQADSPASGSSGPQQASSPGVGVGGRASGNINGGAEGAAAGGGGGGPPPPTLAQLYNPAGSQSARTNPHNPHVIDLRRKLLLRASQSDREDLQLRRGGGGGSGGGAAPREEG
jgi:hypothetical protein